MSQLVIYDPHSKVHNHRRGKDNKKIRSKDQNTLRNRNSNESYALSHPGLIEIGGI